MECSDTRWNVIGRGGQAMIYHLLYYIATGVIFGHETSPSDDLPADWGGLTVEIDGSVPTSKTHRVDPSGPTLIALTDVERAKADEPGDAEVRSFIRREIEASDEFILPDRPMMESRRTSWISYRQALRDLSKPHEIEDPARRPTPAEMVMAWPVRPDGGDPVQHLRERIQG